MNTFDPLLGRGTINVGRIQGGTKVNVVPDLCEIEVERRIVKGETPEQALEDILNVGKSLGIDAEVEVVNSKPAFKLDEDSEIVRMVKEFSGGETSFATGYTEAELYSRGAGIDCVVFGPGNKETIHTSNEYVKIENLEKCTQVFTKLIDRWCF
jgi:acetylornithine deacetylase/succinyl-diaminopimelate desuccinylase-like protein